MSFSIEKNPRKITKNQQTLTLDRPALEPWFLLVTAHRTHYQRHCRGKTVNKRHGG